MSLAWGERVSPMFRQRVLEIATRLGVDPDFLMACMCFESAGTFRADVKNASGSGAVGLIQFMPATAVAMGTTVEALAEKSPEEQLDDVARYFRGYAGKLHTLADVYMVILWPAAVGKPDAYVLFDQTDPAHPKRYIQNHGLDFNQDGKITKAEAAARVQQKLEQGRSPGNLAS